MKYALTTAALVLAMTATANAADPTLWQGDMFVTTATPQCTGGGIIVGDSYRAIFAPRLAFGCTLSSNDEHIRVAI
jgi:hypothetical protein